MQSSPRPAAAIVGGLLWMAGFVGIALVESDGPWQVLALLSAMVLFLGVLVDGLRRAPRRAAATAGIVASAVATLAFALGVALTALDVSLGGLEAYDLLWLAFLGLMIATILFAAGSNPEGSGQRAATALIGLGAAIQAAVLVGLMTGFLSTPWPSFLGALAFGAGWICLGATASRVPVSRHAVGR